MGGYGTPIGETKNYRVYLYVNCSNEYNKYVFKIERKIDHKDLDYSDWCSAEDKPEIEKFDKELNEDYSIYCIKDDGLRDKANFEYVLRQLEKENIQLKERIAKYQEQLSNIKKLII